MYNSLKGKNLVRIPGQRRCLKFKPASSGQESTIASSDEADLIAISNAKRRGQPIYFIRTGDGVTLDVLLDRNDAIRMRDAVRGRVHNGRPNIHAYERIGVALNRL